MPIIKWYNQLRIHLLLGFLFLVVFIAFLAGFTLLKLGQHEQDPDILYRMGEIRSLVEHTSHIALQLSGELNVEKRRIINPELSQVKFDIVTQQLDDMSVGTIKSVLSDNKPQHVNLSNEELQLLATIREQWQRLQTAVKTAAESPLTDTSANVPLTSITGQLNQSVRTLALIVHKRIDQEMCQIRDQLTLVVAVLALTLLGMFGWLFFRLFKPLQELGGKFLELEKGHFDIQFALPRKDEIGQLSGALHNALHRLHCIGQLASSSASTKNGADMIPIIKKQLSQVMPVESVILLRLSNDRNLWLCAETSGRDLGINRTMELSINAEQAAAGARLEKVLAGSPSSTEFILGEVLSRQLAQAGLQSILLLPMTFGSPLTAVVLVGSFSPHAYSQTDTELLESFATILQGSFKHSDEVEAMMLVSVSGLARLAESRDPETGDHLLRMGRYSAIIADALNRDSPYRGMISHWHASALVWLAPLHDIGKVGIGDSILLKQGRLTDEERKVMEQHSVIGGKVLHDCHLQASPFGVDIFELAEAIAIGHHEKYNGSGYPNGLKGDEIPLVARIVAVADVFDALTSKRPYKDAWPVEEALAWMQKQSGSHFDPVVMGAFESSMPRIMEVYEKYRHI